MWVLQKHAVFVWDGSGGSSLPTGSFICESQFLARAVSELPSIDMNGEVNVRSLFGV